ncbi:hypothetical protein K7X08_028301 [Anisodus acutangulus]|uniref:DUF547 domain-containing protein n=1 Tax=Anisodus acutangulus TaxID=402998 RepID=A0A9Q1RBN3_9SOLA|nr:hypothetical protein K7X08_028301 [Anisodus acutangulus]
MANQIDLAAHFPAQSIRKKKSTGGQQKKEELEKEIAELRKMLNHEQRVHEFLEKVYQRKDDSSFSIPNYLPPKMKELLAELAMVENEIAKLETQISQIQCDVNKEKEINNTESKSKQELNNKMKVQLQQLQHGNINNISSALPPNPNKFKGLNDQKIPFETKALHFISKAIKGDYGLNDFRINNEKLLQPMKSSEVVIADQEEENQFHQQVRTFGERISRKSGMIKTPSPLREPRNPTPRRERNAEIPKFMSTPMHEFQPKVMPSPLPTEEDTIHRWPPNKLSENIMKCLVFIFIRLLRTSRAMELEKSGPIARSSNFSLSFRAHEPSFMNSKSTSLLMQQKDSRQQDPYGIFDSEESVSRDIGPYKNLVRFTSTSMEPKCISNSNSSPLFQKLKLMMNSLQNVDLRLLSYQQKLAFWINMYNACIMHGFLQHGLPSSSTPEKLMSLMNKATLNIGGNTINAHAIEHFILRKPVNLPAKDQVNRKGEKNDKEGVVRELHGLASFDPNVMFALCCGTRSSPAVKIYTSDGVLAELEKSKLEYLQASLIVTSTKKIAMPELLLRNIHDFAQDLDSLVEWICQQLPTSGSLRKSIVDCFRGLHGGKVSTIVEKIPYDFEFQYLLSV